LIVNVSIIAVLVPLAGILAAAYLIIVLMRRRR